MPLQNRVQPDGKIVAVEARGLFYGNRGGGFHLADKRVLHPTKRWATKQWICCVLEFKNRKRPLMARGFTELFFLDEVTALAAGHRPCFECRRADALLFAEAWRKKNGLTARPQVKEMDGKLHAERLQGRKKRTHKLAWGTVPNACIVQYGGKMLAKHHGEAFEWSSNGYSTLGSSQQPTEKTIVECLTPPVIQGILICGYKPQWHPSI